MRRGLLAVAAALGGCNLLTLDGLQAGGDGGGATSADDTGSGITAGGQSTASSSSTTSVSASGATGTPSTTSGGEGGGGGVGLVAAVTTTVGPGGGEGGEAGEGGGACRPVDDFCASHGNAALCDDFDEDIDLTGWEMVVANTEGADFQISSEHARSCPNSAGIRFNGASVGEEGGWAELGHTLDGSPSSVRMKVRIWREPTVDDPEGIVEMVWTRDGRGCVLQAQVGTMPPAVGLYASQYDDAGDGVAMGGEQISLGAMDTAGRWLDVELTVLLGAAASAEVKIDGVSLKYVLDPEGAADCDAGADSGSFKALFGPPYNTAPTMLYADDYLVEVD
jgi:hypothetical protein